MQGHGSQTASGGAATLNSSSGIITSEALVGQTSYALTLTNNVIASTSTISLTLSNSAGLVVWPVTIVPGSGSAVITIGFALLTGTVKIAFIVVN